MARELEIIEISDDSDSEVYTSPSDASDATLRVMPFLHEISGLAGRSRTPPTRYETIPIVGKKRSSPDLDDDFHSERTNTVRVCEHISYSPSNHNEASTATMPISQDVSLSRTLNHELNLEVISDHPTFSHGYTSVRNMKSGFALDHETPIRKPTSSHISVVIPRVQLPRNVRTYTAEQTWAPELSHTRQQIASNPDLYLVNDVDSARLPANFHFIDDYVFVGGTSRIAVEARTGCSCRLDNGRNIGCEYVQNCDCLADGAIDQDGKRMGFPYIATGAKRGCLRDKFLTSQYVIYECSDLCSCVSWCRNKLVQHGRTCPLEIFRTKNRGWGQFAASHYTNHYMLIQLGLRCPRPILRGQFIDTYRGEVITDEEADLRERQTKNTKDSYLFSLDKFADQVEEQDLYVVDGEFKGGPTRFVNHSCDPNLAIFCVSTTRGDARVYDLAFFALDDIPAGTELTFDYLFGQQDDENSTTDASKMKTMEAEKGKLATRCLCGSQECRGYLWL